jgi:NO-binding membrane sensor protein with MHYT domain
VATSFLVSVAGSFTAIYCAKRVRTASGPQTSWLVCAALAMGGAGIWAMHFIAMLAFDMGMSVRYDVTTTVASLVIAVAVTGIGLWTASWGATSTARLVGGGTIMGLGVAGMHYTGMAGMRMPAIVTYDGPLVAASVLIAVVASTAALFLAFNLERSLLIGLSAPVMGAAVCGMHYTGMAATTFQRDPTRPMVEAGGLSSAALAYGIFGLTMVMLFALFYHAIGPQASADAGTVA